MRRSDLISGGLLVVFGLVMIFIIVPRQIDSTGGYGLDPKFFPIALLWLIAVMAILLIASRLLTATSVDDTAAPLDRWNWAFVGGAILYLLIGFIAIQTFGFIAGTIPMIAVLMYAMGVRRQWVTLVSVSVAAPIVIDLAMRHLFTIQLP